MASFEAELLADEGKPQLPSKTMIPLIKSKFDSAATAADVYIEYREAMAARPFTRYKGENTTTVNRIWLLGMHYGEGNSDVAYGTYETFLGGQTSTNSTWKAFFQEVGIASNSH
mmetsp:Transcript_9998/g.28133  ORF Transcript_9998/g.28133 Transcript_9998/m.28133 type:complete len:114 (-) Transcript_9998:43-384(-)